MTTAWPTPWNRIPNLSSEDDALSFISRCHQRRGRIGDVLFDLAARGEWRRAHKLAASYFDCGSVKVSALAVAARRKRMDWSATEVLAEARELNLRKLCDEIVLARFEERQNSKPRLVVSYGPKELARQLIALDVLRLRARLHPNQFVCQGGMPAIQAWLHEELPEHTHALTTDFPCFFPTLHRSLVRKTVLLPQAVLEEVLFAPMERMKVKNPLLCTIPMNEEDLSFDVCGVRPGWGIPPGSALSPLAAECALRPILEAVEEKVPGVRVATYADNLIVLAKSQGAAEASKNALISVVEGDLHSRVVDELRLRSTIVATTDGIENFLGYDFRCVDGKVVQNINEERGQMFIDRIHVEWRDCPPEAWDLMRERVQRRIAGYTQSHRFASNVKQIAEEARAEFANW